jgi:hypothetical protein
VWVCPARNALMRRVAESPAPKKPREGKARDVGALTFSH